MVGKYEINDFILYRYLTCGDTKSDMATHVKSTFPELSDENVIFYVEHFYKTFFTQQFKRQASPDGPKVLSVGLNSRGDYRMPSDIKNWD